MCMKASFILVIKKIETVMVSPPNSNAENAQLTKIIWHDPALIEALQKVNAEAGATRSEKQKQTPKIKFWAWGGALAASFLFSFISFNFMSSDAAPDAPAIATVQHYSDAHVEDVLLSDDSSVALNQHSVLQFSEDNQSRKAILSKGEAYFSIKRDEARPFTLKAGNANIRVLGTAFNVNNTLGETHIAVFHGKVAVNTFDGTKRVELIKGQRARVNKHNIIVSTFAADQPDWQLGWLNLDNVLISNAVYQLNRYAKKTVVLSKVDANLRVSGRFKTNDIIGAATLIAQLNKLSINSFDDSIVLSSVALKN